MTGTSVTSEPVTHDPVAGEPGATLRGAGRRLPLASRVDTARVVGSVMVPLLARGVIIRRPAVVDLAARLDADRRAVELLQRLRDRYGDGPLRLRIPVRRMVLLLAPQHVHRVLADSPEPFTPATKEKRSALAHFQPHGVLISTGPARTERRDYNERVLDTPHEVHRGADPVAKVHEEVTRLLADVAQDGTLSWDAYAVTWWRAVRRVVLGDGARDDEQLSDDLRRLRATANWAFLHPRRRILRRRFERRLVGHLERAEPGSLAGVMAGTPATDSTRPEQQVPQWLFAFDAGAWASFRALAVLATQPDQLERARAEVAGRDLSRPQDLPFLRACVQESLRLWPTTPAVLRETTERTRWEGGPMPESTSLLTYAPFFHRNDALPYAHRFTPELWLEPRTAQDWPLIPFSAGPAECPGRNLVLHVASTVLALLLADREPTMADPARLQGPPGQRDRLPGTLSPFSLHFTLTGVGADHVVGTDVGAETGTSTGTSTGTAAGPQAGSQA